MCEDRTGKRYEECDEFMCACGLSAPFDDTKVCEVCYERYCNKCWQVKDDCPVCGGYEE